MKKLVKFFTSSKFVLMLTFFINVALFVAACIWLPDYLYPALSLLVTLILMYQVSKNSDSTANALVWLIVIVIMPFFAMALYMELHSSRVSSGKRRKYQNITYQSFKTLEQNPTVIDTLAKTDIASANFNKMVLNTIKWPSYSETTTTYLADVESYYKDMFAEIKKAKKYVLIECYKINSGKIWEELFNILRLKAREGVEIKFLYDDFGCLNSFEDKKFFKKLNNHGIETVTFNKITPSLVSSFNQCRNHRKLTIIDGNIAYVGGINVGDEYVNIKKRYGVWKDSAIKLNGQAVWSYVVMFFNNWQFASKKFTDVTKYKVSYEKNAKVKEIVQPYETNPINQIVINKSIILKAVTTAVKSIYISAPYIIFNHDLLQAVKLAANSGVEVKILLPGLKRRKGYFYLTRSYYSELLKEGVKIYEYPQGVVNTKMVIVDDKFLALGSADMDFRKLFVQFEAGIVVYNSKTITSAIQDIEKTIVTSHAVTLRDCKQRKLPEKFASRFMKMFTPFM